MAGLVQEEAAAGAADQSIAADFVAFVLLPQPIPSQKWAPVKVGGLQRSRKRRKDRTILRIGWAGLTDSKGEENGRSARRCWSILLVLFFLFDPVLMFSILYFLYSSQVVLAPVSGKP